jgi:hypothetical protein
MRSLSSLLGLFLFLIMAFGYSRVIAFPLTSEVSPLPFFFLFVGILGTSILAFGMKETSAALSATRYLFSTPETPVNTDKTIRVVRHMIVSCYALGGLLFVIEILSSIRVGAMDSLPERALVRSISMGVFGLLAPLVMSEVWLRPLKARLETLADK